MKSIVLFISISLFVVGCTSEETKSLQLFNDISFDLIETEKVVPIDGVLEKEYRSYFDQNSIQIPLFKCVKSDDYILFIGLPFSTSLEELSASGMKSNLEQIYFNGDSINYFYKRYRDDQKYVSVYARNFDGNLVYLLTSSSSSELSDKIFNEEEISKRFDN